MIEEVKNKQNIASDPEYSIWTSASAGSGKTTVLVKRLLRMFLNGIEPSKILCITFTNTGAAEMRNRINSKLAEWATLDDEKLEKEIFELINNKPDLVSNILTSCYNLGNNFIPTKFQSILQNKASKIQTCLQPDTCITLKFIAGIQEVKNKENTSSVQIFNLIQSIRIRVLVKNLNSTHLFCINCFLRKKKLKKRVSDKIKIARTLFTKILDYSNDFKILTIHSFCQQIIKRFPLEADVIPNFQVADEILSTELLLKAKDKILKVESKEIKDAIKYIFTYKNENDFLELLKEMANKKDNLLYLKSIFFSVDGVINEIKKAFKIENTDLNDFEKNFFKDLDFTIYNESFLNNIKDIGKTTDIKFANNILNILKEENINSKDYKSYISFFLTKNNTIRKNLITSAIENQYPEFSEFIKKESQRVFEFVETKNNIINFEFTSYFLRITYYLFDVYSKLKRENGYLDYSDLIFETSKLLNDSKYRNIIGDNLYSSWINYKLDEGLDHLLIDEAQDTSPIQWDIVKSITDEFFSGYGQKGEKNRTIFVVGDEKQSIFSFQGAEPKNFDLMLKYYKEKVESCGKKFENIYLETSFRSLKSILNIADLAFKDPFRKMSLSRMKREIKHNIVRNECLGRVEIWPLIGLEENNIEKVNNSDVDKDNSAENWKINYLDEIELSNKQQLAKIIVNQINDWFKNERIIYSRKDKCKRVIKYSDIMILVKNRDKDFINYLIKQFNKYNIPTMGNDKFNLNDNIISQDIISLCKFLLFNENDLNLANIIKSPFLNMSEDDLYNLCDYKNQNNCSLWKSFLNNKNYIIQYDLLKDFIEKSSQFSIYELFYYIFKTKNLRKNFKERFQYIADEVINEFLILGNDYEKTHNNSTLLNFINFIENTNIEIKRDVDNSTDEIKIITVHSSKGLESPIIILPDTNHASRTIQKINDILIYEEEGNDFTIPILQKEKSEFVNEVKEYMKNKTEEEYLRLLYVAITRAENELYVCGHKRKGDIKENSWYGILKHAVESSNFNCKKDENFDSDIIWIGDEYEFKNRLPIAPGKDNKEIKIIDLLNYKNEIDDIISIINFKNKKSNEIKVINPSTYYNENTLKNPQENSENIEIGKLVHKLLEILPEINKNEWEQVIDIYLKNNRHSNKIKNTILNILNDENFLFLFSNNSKAEVPIFGKIEGNIISAKIDRMSIIDNTIYLVDYKNTNILPTKVPQKYIKQLELYKKLIEKIYPNKKIECYILWTSFGKISKINF